jgi:hypothetical protein
MAEAVWGCKPVNQFDSAAAIDEIASGLETGHACVKTREK